MATRFFNPTDTIMVANSPRIGVGPGFDSQGCVTFLSQILLSQLVLNPLGHPWVKWFGHPLQQPSSWLQLNRVWQSRNAPSLGSSKSPFSRPPTTEVLLKASRNTHSGNFSRECRSRNALVTPMVDVQLGNAVYLNAKYLSILKPGSETRGSRKCMPLWS